MKGIFSSK